MKYAGVCVAPVVVIIKSHTYQSHLDKTIYREHTQSQRGTEFPKIVEKVLDHTMLLSKTKRFFFTKFLQFGEILDQFQAASLIQHL